MELYKHQQDIIDADPKKCGLFLGTGSGKTRTALLLARGYTLVICPKTQRDDQNWEREAIKLGLKIKLTVISKETFRKEYKQLLQFDTVIIDEAHTCLGVTPNIRYRNRKPIPKSSQLFEALEEYLKTTEPKRLYLCTATIIKSPMTVWAAAKILGREIDFYAFRNKYYIPLPMPGREIWSPRGNSELKDDLARLVRSLGYVGRLEDFFDVPEQTFRTVHIELTKEQKDRIKELHTDYPDAIVQIGKRHQVENGVLAGDEYNQPEYFENGKIAKILELAEEFPRMVIFCKYRAQIDQIYKATAMRGTEVMVMTGDTKDRGQVIAAANRATHCIFICQAQISAGWELPEYPVMIFASRTYSFVDYSQALGRIQRANNIKKNLYINLIVKGGIDEAVNKSLSNKQDFDERIYLGI